MPITSLTSQYQQITVTQQFYNRVEGLMPAVNSYSSQESIQFRMGSSDGGGDTGRDDVRGRRAFSDVPKNGASMEAAVASTKAWLCTCRRHCTDWVPRLHGAYILDLYIPPQLRLRRTRRDAEVSEVVSFVPYNGMRRHLTTHGRGSVVPHDALAKDFKYRRQTSTTSYGSLL
uniref:Uncharacterized protein n=1 Tax=Ascaris lumbricoides TaxID=6252 RepID=A0A0M3I423_ASCLU